MTDKRSKPSRGRKKRATKSETTLRRQAREKDIALQQRAMKKITVSDPYEINAIIDEAARPERKDR